LLMALQQASKTGLPVVAQMAQKAERGLDRLASGADYIGAKVVGANCIAADEARMFVERLHRTAKVPLSAFPSAGEASSKEFGAALKEIVDAGARLVGGCCGAGPDHIRAAAALIGRGR